MSDAGGRSYRFTHALTRRPGASVARGLRAGGGPDPDVRAFEAEHDAYVQALREAGVEVRVLDALEAYPDSVFVEDAAICVGGFSVQLRPGAASRFGEAAAIRPALEALCDTVQTLPGDGHVDGGDVLMTGTELIVGLSARTDAAGFEALAELLSARGIAARRVETPPTVLHLKSDCAALDDETVYATPRLAASGCFEGYRVIETPPGEEASANLIRVNDTVLLAAGHPRAQAMLEAEGYRTRALDVQQAALLDGGLSCMSLRLAP